MKKLTLILICLIIAFAASPSWSKLTVETGGGTEITSSTDNTTVEIDCRGFDGLWVEAEIIYQQAETISVTYETYKNKRGKWSWVSEPDAVTKKLTPIIMYVDNTTSEAPGFYLPLPRNTDKARVQFDGCTSCTGSVYVGIDDTSK